MFQNLLIGLLSVAWLAAVASAGGAEQDKPLEIEGTLETGIVAVGGETTGTILRAGKQRWELDLGNDAELKKQAEKWNKQKVVVTGKLRKQAGIETPERQIIVVATMRAVK